MNIKRTQKAALILVVFLCTFLTPVVNLSNFSLKVVHIDSTANNLPNSGTAAAAENEIYAKPGGFLLRNARHAANFTKEGVTLISPFFTAASTDSICWHTDSI